MTCSAWYLKFVLFVSLVFSVIGGSMASSLHLPYASELKGVWQLSDEHQQCDVSLTDQPLPEGSIWSLNGDNACLTDMFGEVPAGWRPTPDGITITDEQGSGLAFFAQESDGWFARFAGGRELMMKPNKKSG
ncbi:protease inhibitor Inh/omp19 family protein [Photorhabdus khanii]|uniref:Proteinase inhibitor n=2 Tax=Photorhabdus khanii TaxID=1004150 RepID=A0A4V2X8D7_9GAMM|nr:protease inhibitor Inh/omp19 family protein [Photorhabdus khanii]ETS32381.1 Protease inhibitor Inh [Photorhabdus khanii NC19]TDB59465.1 proteinase inhibitor [Photorhabdus khanii subsp. guanajuatensis]